MEAWAIPDIATKRAELAPDKVAFRSLSSGEAVTYREFEDRACRVAGLLQRLGVERGDSVAIMCRNRIEFFEVLFGCAKLGAILVPLNWRMPAAELQPLLEEAQPAVLFHGEEDQPTVRELTGDAVAVSLDDHGDRGYRQLRDAAPIRAQRTEWPQAECWYVIYTSGTTGRPKAVMQTYGMALINYINIRQAMGIGAGDVSLNYLPLFHTAGINLVTLPTFFEGGENLVLPGFDIDAVMALLAEARLDTFFAVPAVYRQLSQHAHFDSLDLGGVRSWGCGGAPLPDDLVRTYLKRGACICNGMGMTETGPTVFLMDEGQVERKIGSVGKPQLLCAVRIVDAGGDDVEEGGQGELWFSGPGVTPGYWKREDATRDAFSDDGWLKSGDIGRRDEDGYYYIVGRLKDMFISGGENVYPAEVENQLAMHPDISEAAVVAISDETWGEVGCAYVLPRPGCRLPADDALRDFCRQRLAAYKVPRVFVEVDDFPRTAAGKIQKHLLAECR